MPLPAWLIPALISAGSAAAGFLGDKKEKQQRIKTVSPEQEAFINRILGQMGGQNVDISQSPLYQQGSGFLQELLSGSPEAFSKFEGPYQSMFQQEIVPGIAERFSGLGAGSRNSSAFQQSLGTAGRQLTENLAALRGGLQNSALGQSLAFAQQPISNFGALSSLGLTPTFATRITEGGPNALSQLMAPILAGFGGAFGKSAGGSAFNSLFGG